MKKHVLFFMLVSLLATAGLVYTSCGEDNVDLTGTTWQYGFTRAEYAAEMAAEMGISIADAEAMLIQYGVPAVIPIMEIEFTATVFSMYTIDLKEDTRTLEGTGTYTVSGSIVTLTVDGETMTGTVSGNRLTIEVDGETIILNKK